MKKLFTSLVIGMLLCKSVTIQAQGKAVNPDSIQTKMRWFNDAKLGIFITWGIYAVKGIPESWAFYLNQISLPDYMLQLKDFTASKYDPAGMAGLIKESGARYAVFVTQHHDGVALWPATDYPMTVVKKTPAKRDLVQPLFDELRKRDIKCGAYFSLLNWAHEDFPRFRKDSLRYDAKQDTVRLKRFTDLAAREIKDLSVRYNPDLFWFDGDWDLTAAQWKAADIRQQILSHNPNAIINARLPDYGDYATPEQDWAVGASKNRWWELCMTINNSWGFKQRDTAWKSPYEVIHIFAEVIGNGGNLLLDIGPRADGSIPEPEMHLLKELGKWTHKHSDAIFNTVAGLKPGHFYGPSTFSKDSSTLYLFLPAKSNGEVYFRGLKNKVKSIHIVGNDTPLTWHTVGQHMQFINVPPAMQDEYMTVLAVKLDGPAIIK